jgi:hypothetical protein
MYCSVGSRYLYLAGSSNGSIYCIMCSVGSRYLYLFGGSNGSICCIICCVGSRYLYLAGGEFPDGSACRSVWRYDPCLDNWQEMTSMNVARSELGE